MIDKLLKPIDRVLYSVLLVMATLMVLSITSEILLSTLPRVTNLPLFGDALTIPAWLAQLSSPINTTSQTLLVWIGILGSALALRERKHLGVDVLVRVYPPAWQRRTDRFDMLMVGVFSLVVLIGGGWICCRKALETNSSMPGFEKINMAWFYSVLILTGALNVLYCVRHFCNPEVFAPDTIATQSSATGQSSVNSEQ